MIERLFVYGTLAPGRPNEHILKDIDGSWQPATVKGFLHDEGWGATMGYPAIKLDDAGEVVNGFLFTSDNLDEHWPRIDEFEGDAYERVLVDVTLADGIMTNAFVYALSGKIVSES